MTVVIKTYIGINLQVSGESLDEVTNLIATVKQDVVTVGKHYEKESTDRVKVMLLESGVCTNCGEPYAKCRCGRPNRSPLV